MKKLSIVLATVLAFASVSAFAGHGKDKHAKGKKPTTEEKAPAAEHEAAPKAEEHKAE